MKTKPHVQKYVLRMTFGFTAYVLGLVAMNQLYGQLPYGHWLILLPVAPLVYLAVAIIRFVSEGLDELQRKVITEAMAFSGVATGFTCFSYLFLRDMGAPEFHAEWAFYFMWAYYVIGGIFSWRRYK
jgi:hypothetical protein